MSMGVRGPVYGGGQTIDPEKAATKRKKGIQGIFGGLKKLF